MLGLAIEYLNATINRNTQIPEPEIGSTGLAKPGKTNWLTCTDQGLPRQDAAGRVFGRVWNRTEPF
jgi:hypothetical protein